MSTRKDPQELAKKESVPLPSHPFDRRPASMEELAEFDRTLASDPSKTDVHIDLGAALCQLDYVEEAVELLEPLDQDERLERSQRAFALATRGRALLAMAQYNEADALLGRAIALESGIDWFHGLRGWAMENLHRVDDALLAYQNAMEKGSWDGNLWWRKGVANALHLGGRLKDARQEYRQVIDTVKSLVPSPDVDNLSLLGWCHYRLGEFDKARSSS